MQAGDDLQTGTRARERGEQYQSRLVEIRAGFEAGTRGSVTIAARAAAVDELIRGVWLDAGDENGRLSAGVALVAVGGYGRRELFPQSDVDVLFLLDNKTAEKLVKDSIRKVNQELWDVGVRVAPATRKAVECEQFDPEVAEFTLSLLDHRLIAGNQALYERVTGAALGRLLQRENKAILGRLVAMTRARHTKYGDTLFHLEPNIKDYPGGLRDVHVCAWMEQLRQAQRGEGTAGVAAVGGGEEEFRGAVEFLDTVRCFLHYRHERDDNTLDWQAQDAAAATAVGLPQRRGGEKRSADAAYWMRIYFRHARSIDRKVRQVLDSVPVAESAVSRLRSFKLRRAVEPVRHGYGIDQGQLVLDRVTAAGDGSVHDPAADPDLVLQAFVDIAQTGAGVGQAAEERLSQALPLLSSRLEEGAALWLPLRAVLMGRYAGDALRAMHAIGMLELLVPEFHGIDALVIRDAYHRYTVDEHTFVAIDTLHALAMPKAGARAGAMAEWTGKFSAMLRDTGHPELLYLGALLHDTGKGRSSGAHAKESVALARSVLGRLELDGYESELVLSLIENHLEMSAALRRDIFDAATVQAFAAKVGTAEALRMLTLFTYADIAAVHPDALTPWKAENIWRLYMATSNFLDRSVEDERVSVGAESELVHRVAALLPGSRTGVGQFLEGFPERYLRTRTPEQVRAQYEMTTRFGDDPFQLEFRYAPGLSEITLVTRDRPLLFATMAGALAAWGMNIVTADAFSNRERVIVDSFRFTDSFRTLELNASEHERFVASVRGVLTGAVSLDKLLSGRRKARPKVPMVVVEPRIDFDDHASSSSTLVQVVAQDVPGLLRALSLTLADHGCNIEVALVDTEGETAIDVFYLTKDGGKLRLEEEEGLRRSLLESMKPQRQPISA